MLKSLVILMISCLGFCELCLCFKIENMLKSEPTGSFDKAVAFIFILKFNSAECFAQGGSIFMIDDADLTVELASFISWINFDEVPSGLGCGRIGFRPLIEMIFV